jgi:hypothetical protein
VEDTKQYIGETDDQINKVQRIAVAEKRKAFEIHIDRQHRADTDRRGEGRPSTPDGFDREIAEQ